MLDHKMFLNMLFSGSRRVIEHRDELNSINVFPVPDGDTGSNLSHLMRTILQDTSISDDASESMASLKQAALRGSRGNSGMIFSQFFIHIANVMSKNKINNTHDFISMCEAATGKTYEAVMTPEDGTVLTVMKEWIHAMKQTAASHSSVLSLIGHSLPHVYHSLESTKVKMEAVSGRKVVDSGAKGFVYFLEGLVNPQKEQQSVNTSKDLLAVEAHTLAKNDVLLYRYCTEFMIIGISDSSKLKEAASSLGDSVVIAGDDQQMKVHLHTNEPHSAVDLFTQFGTVTYQKVEDMKRQYESIHDA